MNRDQVIHMFAGIRVAQLAPETGLDSGVIDRVCGSLAEEWNISAEEVVVIVQAFYDLIIPILEGGHIQ